MRVLFRSVGDARAAGGDGARARLLHQADFGEFPAFEAFRRGGERVDPKVGLAALCGALDEPGAVERTAVGHQRGAGDTAAVEGGLEIGSANVRTQVTNAQPVCRLLLEKKTEKNQLARGEYVI